MSLKIVKYDRSSKFRKSLHAKKYETYLQKLRDLCIIKFFSLQTVYVNVNC